MDSSASFVWSIVNLFVALCFLWFVLGTVVLTVLAIVESSTGKASKFGNFLRSFGRKK